MKLYFNPRSRAVIAKWMLDECGAQYQTVPISFETGEHKTAKLQRVNPAGKLPALEDGEHRLFENAAICLYLAEKFPEAGLAPPPGHPQRGRYLSLMVYSTAQVEPSMGDFLSGTPTPPQRGWTRFEETRRVLDDELGEKPWILGERFSAADVMIGSMLIWKRMGGGAADSPRLEAYLDRLLARPHAIKLGG